MYSIEKFLKWYKTKFVKKPISVMIITIVAILTGINTVFDTASHVVSLGHSTINLFTDKYKEDYQKLNEIRTGMNADYVGKLFGPPSISRKHEYLKGYFERLYVKDQFFLYLVTNEDNSIKYYSVTQRMNDFNPYFPIEIAGRKKQLGKTKLVELNNNSPEFVMADMSSKFISYTETNYYGNSGLYKYYQFGYAPAGITQISDQQNSDIHYLVDNIDPIVLHRFRQTYIPNSFSVIDEEVEEDFFNYYKESMIGIDYFEARGYN
ncbi:ETEC_3214 domain-containing protein [Paenibacillus guangzhouensis]|uniref:ETEC_3214 domain-containing protein n=1 Tax=Paenibacillus guangzhouensis TaxID=1473112 RepID=UPI0012673E3C|nr:ETEC_3214 domain-containing protein [Paenibacillus guangzhouensis]